MAYEVARQSLIRHASIDVDVRPIKLDSLIRQGLYARGKDPLAATEFTFSRFLTPYLCDFSGWALFCDCDFLFLSDVAALLAYADPKLALYCVKHDHKPTEAIKMGGRTQTAYPRKNWSSFMLLNCGHPSTRRLTPEVVNSAPGAFLHRMQWAKDDEIGSLPESWNWLAGWSPLKENERPHAVHFTSGGPWLEAYQDVPFADAWRKEAGSLRRQT